MYMYIIIMKSNSVFVSTVQEVRLYERVLSYCLTQASVILSEQHEGYIQ